LPGEAEDVFDRICPKEQIWRIDCLHIDLGELEYDVLEPQLNYKIRQMLYEKLTELALYQNNTNKSFEILHKNESHLQMMQAFFRTGILPWSYYQEIGTIDKMLADQLQYHFHETIKAIKEVGVTSEIARKRMAWQLSDANLDRIIKGLEPGNHETIREFYIEMERIQTNERIVQCTTYEFKKQIYLWILNHLLTERGTLFNKIAFVRSSILQMARHYSISYHELIMLIQRATSQFYKQTTGNSTLIQALKVLTHEDTAAEQQNGFNDGNEGSRGLPEKFLYTEKNPAKSQKHAIEQLVEHLHALDSEQIRETIKQVLQRDGNLDAIAYNLTLDVFKILIKQVSRQAPAEFSDGVIAFCSICSKTKTGIAQKEIWVMALTLALKHDVQKLNVKKFIEHFLDELCQKKSLVKINVLQALAEYNPGPKQRSSVFLPVFDAIVQLWNDEPEQGKSYDEPVLERILVELSTIESGHTNIYAVNNLYRKATQIMLRNSQVSFEALQKFRNKTYLERFLLQSMTFELAVRLADSGKHAHCTLLNEIRQLAKDNVLYKFTGLSGHDFEKAIVSSGIRLILLNPAMNKARFILALFREVKLHMQDMPLQNLVKHLYEKPLSDLSGHNAIINAFKKANRLQGLEESQPLELKIKKAIQDVKNRPELARYLLQHFSDAQFVQLRSKKRSFTHDLTNYFLNQDDGFKDTLIANYIKELKGNLKTASTHKISDILSDLFWKCLLDVNFHRGSEVLFKRLYTNAVVYRFSASYLNRCHQTKEQEGGKGGVMDLKQRAFYENISRLFHQKDISAIKQKNTSSRSLIVEGLEFYPELLKQTLNKIDEKIVSPLLADIIEFEMFAIHLKNDAHPEIRTGLTSLLALYRTYSDYMNTAVREKISVLFFKQALLLIKTKKWRQSSLDKLVRELFVLITMHTQTTLEDIVADFANKGRTVTNDLRKALIRVLPPFATVIPVSTVARAKNNSEFLKYENNGLTEELIYYVLREGQLPPWHLQPGLTSLTAIINELIAEYPAIFIQVFRKLPQNNVCFERLGNCISMAALCEAIGHVQKNMQSTLNIARDFYDAFDSVRLENVSLKEVQRVIKQKILLAWKSKNWKMISVSSIWNELCWELGLLHGVNKLNFITEIKKHAHCFPLAFQLDLKTKITDAVSLSGSTSVDKKELPVIPSLKNDKLFTGLEVKNAGLVLLNSYVPILFSRLKLLHEQQFISIQHQEKAVHYLQYIATGLTKTEEHLLLLNKLFCGLSLTHPVSGGITIEDSERELINGLIKAAVGYWPAAGDTSINGFRGNWLVRDGLLHENENKWELHVEKRVYDVLIYKSPFSFSIIKFPWMKKPLHVNWPY